MRFALGRDLVLVALERSVAVAARMIRNRNRDAPDVVRVVALGELVALSGAPVFTPGAMSAWLWRKTVFEPLWLM